jgi:hypothetical protein
MNLRDLFASPEWHPFYIDLQRQTLSFARLSREAYLESLFLGTEFARGHGDDLYEVRLDDVFLAAADAPSVIKPIHYVLHTAFCCSTLLARYFELLPECFVMKEPQLLAELGMPNTRCAPQWPELFALTIRLLSRTYHEHQHPVIKANVPTNILGRELLEQNSKATVIFLINPLRDLLLAALKSRRRRGQIRYWNHYTAMQLSDRIPELATVDPDDLSDAEAIAYWWLVNRFICQDLLESEYRSRVLVVDGTELAKAPTNTLPPIMAHCGLPLDERELKRIVNHSSVHKHAKDLSTFYDAESRRHEMMELESRFAKEADRAILWTVSRGFEETISEPVGMRAAYR